MIILVDSAVHEDTAQTAWYIVAGGVASWVAVVATVGGGIAWIWKRHLREPFKAAVDLLRDWKGEPARPGYDGRPGIPVRLALLEKRITIVENEVTPNGGASLKDIVVKTHLAVQQLTNHNNSDSRE